MVIEKWLDGVFIWSSENGNLTVEIPYGWYTPRRHGMRGRSPYMIWKKKHRQELKALKSLTGNKSTSKKWMSEKQKELRKLKKSGRIN